ncbi:hypothetical protein PWT90_10075 [Aphanocladium album]|nr:hypothetical protein PWT90_10075 [Aphanocladium album]
MELTTKSPAELREVRSTLAGMEPSQRLPRPLFIYGTLRAKPLLAWALTGDSSRVGDIEHMIKPAEVFKYTRLAVKQCDYPAIIESKSESDRVDGYLLQVDTTSQRKKLDEFEGEAYAIHAVHVRVLHNEEPTGEIIDADVYVWNGDMEMLAARPWELETFINDRLQDWLDLFDGMELIGEDDEV